MPKPNQIPKTYEDVYRDYFPLALWHVNRTPIDNQEVEDVAMSIMEKFILNDVLADYDPEREGAANFKTFFSGFVTSYLRHHIERDNIRRDRSTLSKDQEVGGMNAGDGTMPLLDFLGKTTPDQTEDVEMDLVVERVRAKLPEKKLLFFDMAMLQVKEHGKVDVPELAEMFGVARWTVALWFRALRPYFDAELANG